MAKPTKEQIDRATTQEHIPVNTVKDGIIITKDGGMRIVLLIGAINFSLKSEEEQNSIIYQYQSFINSINFPVQILVQSRIMDLTNYLRDLNDHLKKQTNDLLIEMTESYIDFVTDLISDASIMNKRFYVIIPVKPISAVPKTGGISKIFGKKKEEVTFSDNDFDHYRQELLEHAQTVAGGLSAIGLQVAVLNTQQVVELLYTSYNPEEGITEKLTDVEDLESNIIQEDPTVLQQQVIENMFAQRFKDEKAKNNPDVQLNIQKDAPPILGGPTAQATSVSAPQNIINQPTPPTTSSNSSTTPTTVENQNNKTNEQQ